MTNDGILHVGFDLETTGLEPHDGNVPIQVGICFRTPDDRTIRWDRRRMFHPAGSFTWQARAFEVNGFTLEEISDDSVADLPELVDFELYERINEYLGDRRAVPVGWNVGSFDMQFQRWFPLLGKLFGYQSVDLNTLNFLNLAIDGPAPSKPAMNRRAEEWGETEGLDVAWHDAGWDACASLFAFEEYQRAFDPAAR